MNQARTYKTTGVVLRARNLGEADKILTIFTTERGKIDAVAKGVRRQKSALSGRLEFMSEATISLHRGRNLDVITSAEILHSHFDAIVRPNAFAAASMIAELIDAFCELDMPVPQIYELLSNVLVAFDGVDEQLLLLPRFQLQLLDALGLAPPCDECVRCGTVLDREAWLDLDSGGLAGHECRVAWMNVLELDADDVKNFRGLAAGRRSQTRAELYARANVARAIETIITYHLGRRPKAGAHAAEFVTPAS
ncbi:MAG: DNA repair protein RecO [Candidatus Eremiobacteraeota bacterium]|nr:DNA repair protein RecO [Candidatus Eremiobacteraeota bacterium]